MTLTQRARSACLHALLAMALGCGAAAAATSADPPTKPVAPAVPPATLARIVAAAMQSEWAYQRLEDLTDKIGPRPAGSAGYDAAATQVADAMRAIGAQVSLQPAKVALIAAKSPAAIRHGKTLFYRQNALPLDQAYACAGDVMARNMMEPDAGEGIDAFLAKRPPVWRS
jgi:enoyl-CoA hydratase/carnithine racemase